MLISSTKKVQSRVVQGNELRRRPSLIWGTEGSMKTRKSVGKSMDLWTSVTLVEARAGCGGTPASSKCTPEDKARDA